MNQTKARILDAAERLIAVHGLDVSLRTITSQAGVNLAAINYHYQSKDALIDAVVARHIEPINESRLEMLDRIEAEHGDGPLPLEPILEAFLAPVIQMQASEHVRTLFGRLYSMPDAFLNRIFDRHLSHVLARFSAAFARAIPEMPLPDRMWCIVFTVGAMVHVMAWSGRLAHVSNGVIDGSDTERLTKQIVKFAAAGFRALQGESMHA